MALGDTGVPSGAACPHRHHRPCSLAKHPMDTGYGHPDPGCPHRPLNTPGVPMDGITPVRGLLQAHCPCPPMLGTGRDEGRCPGGDGADGERGQDDRGPRRCLGDTDGEREDRGAKSQSIHPWRGPGQWFIHRRRGPRPGRAGARRDTCRGRCRTGRRRRAACPSPGSRHSPRSAGSRDAASAWGLRAGGPGGPGGPGPTCTHQAAPADAEIRGAGAAAGAVQHPAEGVVEVVPHSQAVEVADVGGCRSPAGREGGDAGGSRDPQSAR